MNQPDADSRALRVLHLRDSAWIDGPGRTILETGKHLDPARVQFHIGVLVPAGQASHPMVEAARAAGLNVATIVDHGGLSRDTIGQIVALIDQHGVELLHASEFRSAVLALAARRRRRVVLVRTTHGWIANNRRRKLVRFLDKVLLRGFASVILVSEAMRALVPRWWLPRSRVSMLHNALVLDSYGREHLDTPRRAPDLARGITLLNVGRLSPEKGQDLLLRAMAQLTPEYAKLRLKFAGIGPLEADLKALAAELGLAHRVEFLGYIDDMPKLYRDVDLIVQSSLTEGLPNVILEGAYLRVPMLATRVGGTGEVIQHGESGYLIAPGSIEQLVEGLRAYLQDPERFVRMGASAHHRILRQFSFDARTEALTKLYERLLGRGRGPR